MCSICLNNNVQTYIIHYNGDNLRYISIINICDLILETDPVVTFGSSRNTNFKYSSHCSYLALDCSHARYTLKLEVF